MSQLTTEDWIDASAYIAARATWAVGITKTAAVLRNLKNVGTAVTGAAASFADKFIKIFDNVIGASPTVITAEGTVIVNASPVVVAETAQAIYSLNDLQGTTGGNKPEIIKDVDGVLDNEKKATEVTQSLDELRQSVLNLEKRMLTNNELKRLGFRGDNFHKIDNVNQKTGHIRVFTEIQGDIEKAQGVLNRVKKEFAPRGLIAEDSKVENGIRRIFCKFEDGSHIQLRTEGKSGHVKVEITDVLINTYEKITFK